jgi:predicted PurR-regulated permease PerM
MHGEPSGGVRGRFFHRLTLGLVVSALFVLVCVILWKSAQVLLLIFAGVLLAVVLRSCSGVVRRLTRLPERWALTLTIFLLAGLAGFLVWVSAAQVAGQAVELRENLVGSLGKVLGMVEQTEAGEQVAEQAEAMQRRLDMGTVGKVWGRAAGIFSTTLGALSGLLIFLFMGVFFAYNPGLYLSGLLRLVPLDFRPRAREVLTQMAATLRGWLLGQLVGMVFISLTIWLLLWAFGVPMAMLLALLTGALNFIPYLGPFIAVIPMVLVALTLSPEVGIYVFVLFLIIQTLESDVVMPLVFQKTVELPPVLTIAGQLALGSLLGVLGIIVATPITAVLMVMVRMLYVEGVLGDDLNKEVRMVEGPPGGK